MKIKIDRNHILAMHLLSSRDTSRHVLCRAVHFEITGTRCILVATDGRKLGAMLAGEVLTQSDEPESITVNFDVTLLKAMPKGKGTNGSRSLDIEFDGRRVLVSPHGKDKPRLELESIEGEFPKWRHVIPSGKLESPVDPTFNWRLLEPFMKIAEMCSQRESSSVRIRQSDPLSPMLVLLPALRTFVGAIMPMRVEDYISAPDWAIEAKPETPATT